MTLSAFHPAVSRWFSETLGEPTPPQVQGWPLIREGKNVLIAAPTGSGKTLAAFLSSIDQLLRQGPYLPDETQVLYVSPLKALGNDIQKNLSLPLSEISATDPFLPQVRVLVRTGDTSAKDRATMTKRPPHILVTTPESLYILLTTDGGRRILSTVKTVIVDEIHALARDKRGSHLALSLERLEALTGGFQRIGLSATQKPLEAVARFLVGKDRDCALVDVGHLRELDLGVEVPKSPLAAVCSHETWEEIYARMAELIGSHRTTLIFVNTRKMAERIAARLTKILGEEAVTSHHGSLSKKHRLDAEQRLKEGKLRALVATASLELGIDVGDVDLALQVGASRSIATFLQRAGRAGHMIRKTPKARIFALTLDELVEATAILRAIRKGILDRTPQPPAPLDILAQQVVAACVPESWAEDQLFERFRRAWPYRDLTWDDFDQVVNLHAQGRRALLHRDGVGKRVMATRRARLTAILSGGAIPDTADYQVVMEPDGAPVGTVNEDFAIESNMGDIFQLGNTSWRILKVEPGIVRVADAKGQPPTLPFWTGEAPSRTAELSAELAQVREECDGPAWASREAGLGEAAATEVAEYVAAGRKALGGAPTQKRVILERFFDESGGMQLVVHAPFGGRINRAWGLALRKRFCRGFGFELQAAANEEAIILSLGPQHSFPLEEVFDYLHPNTARELLIQALLQAPMFEVRWRWNVTRALLVERMMTGKKVPAPLIRMRAQDWLVQAFPQAAACPETLPSADIDVPMEHPIVRQTVEDCLNEAMDVDGFLQVLRDLRSGLIERRAIETTEPSPFAQGILNAAPYAFLDDAPLEERRTQAVISRRTLDVKSADELGGLDPEAIARVREEAWPKPESAEEVHEALLWMGYVTAVEGRPWQPWLDELARANRVVLEGDRWFAAEASRDPVDVMRGRLEALGPVESDDPALLELERRGIVLRGRFEGRTGWCDRRLLARIHRYTLERLRKEIEPVTATEFLRFLGCWQHVDEEHRLEGPRGVAEVIRQLAGFEIPAAAWEASVLPLRVKGYKREWLDSLTLSGEAAWGRLWGGGASAIRITPICLVPRDELDSWVGLSSPSDVAALSGPAKDLHAALLTKGAMFPQELARAAKLVPAHVEMGLGELIAQGLLTCDSFGALRWLIVPPSRRRGPMSTVGRWSPFRREAMPAPEVEFTARQLLRRTGVVFRRTIEREKLPVPWRDLARCCRTLEARGEIRGGRFVAGFSGEQFALPEAVSLLRAVRKRGELQPVSVSAADPLNYRGILTPDERVSSVAKTRVQVG
ncbi:MAG TPA: DEAD/DEAH box helicase [Planctomycetota bacterium]|nr:DEAD/DEAH box helicase [Planctomycetota bacterium]